MKQIYPNNTSDVFVIEEKDFVDEFIQQCKELAVPEEYFEIYERNKKDVINRLAILNHTNFIIKNTEYIEEVEENYVDGRKKKSKLVQSLGNIDIQRDNQQSLVFPQFQYPEVLPNFSNFNNYSQANDPFTLVNNNLNSNLQAYLNFQNVNVPFDLNNNYLIAKNENNEYVIDNRTKSENLEGFEMLAGNRGSGRQRGPGVACDAENVGLSKKSTKEISFHENTEVKDLIDNRGDPEKEGLVEIVEDLCNISQSQPSRHESVNVINIGNNILSQFNSFNHTIDNYIETMKGTSNFYGNCKHLYKTLSCRTIESYELFHQSK